MSIPIPDNFDEFPGQLSDYDTPFGFSLTNLDQILANTHVDLRSFDQAAVIRLRTQADLDGLSQAFLDTQTQAQLEEIVTVAGEGWQTIGTPTGLSASFTVGESAARGDWSVGQATLSGSALSLTIQSSMPQSGGGAISINGMDFLSFVVPDFHNFNTATSWIQLCSNDAGDFTTATSPQVPFSSSVGSSTELKFAMADFSTVDKTRITGVKINFVSASSPTAGTNLTVMALRAYVTGYVPMTLDLNTRRGIITSAPTMDGNDPSPLFVPLVRGEHGGTADPRPIDGTLTMYFDTGSLGITNPATAANIIQFLFRENQTDTTGEYVIGELDFKSNSTRAQSFKMMNGVQVSGSNITYTTPPVLSPNTFYIFQADLTNQTLTMALYNSDVNGNVGSKIWSSTSENTGTNINYVRKQGRVGWWASLIDRDVGLYNFTATSTAFSTIRTKVFNTYTPVDGAQLTASFAEDTNLWNSWNGQDATLDFTKTLSGVSSYASTYPAFSNEFLVEDWTQTYVQYSIWVPAQVTSSNAPSPVIRSNDTLTTTGLPQPILQPNQWNDVTIDLSQLQGIITGVFYQLWIESAPDTRTPYEWWIDNTLIGRRNVSWQIRANSGVGVWREFRDAVNNPTSAIHFPPEERGTELQLQAVALTEDAWVSSYTLQPRYASLGRPIGY